MKVDFGELDERILAALSRHPLSTPRLAAEVGAAPQVVERRCTALKRQGRLLDLRAEDVKILRVLQASAGPLSTADLARKVLRDQAGDSRARSRVHRRCERLTRRAQLLSTEKVPSPRKLYFFPATGDVLNKSNFGGVQEAVDALREIGRRHPLPRGAQIPPKVKEELRREYLACLRQLAAKASPVERQRLRAFEAELMRVLSGTTRSSVARLFGLRPFHPKEDTWKLADGGRSIEPGLIPGKRHIWVVVVSSREGNPYLQENLGAAA